MKDFASLLLWSKGAETDCCLVLPLLQGFCKSHPEICGSLLEAAALKYVPSGKIFNQILHEEYIQHITKEARRTTVESVIHLLPVLVKKKYIITAQFSFFRTSCQLEKKNKVKSHSWP